MIKETFGQRFARLRKNKGFTQEGIAAKLNISGQAVSKWENDLSAPDISILPDIADLLNVSVDILLGREKEDIVKMSTPLPPIVPRPAAEADGKTAGGQTPDEAQDAGKENSGTAAAKAEDTAAEPVVATPQPAPEIDTSNLTLRVKILSADGDVVKVNLPMALVEALASHEKDGTVKIQGVSGLDKIDLSQVIALAKKGVLGNLVNITSANGDIVKVYVGGPEDDASDDIFAGRKKHNGKGSSRDFNNFGADLSEKINHRVNQSINRVFGPGHGRKGSDGYEDELEDQIDGLRDELKDLTESLAEEGTDIDAANAKIAEKTEQLKELSQRLKDFRAKHGQDDERIEDLEDDIQDLRDDISDLTDDLTDDDADVEGITAKIKEKSAKMAELAKELKDLKEGSGD